LSKEISIAVYGRRYLRRDDRLNLDEERLSAFFSELKEEFGPLGIELSLVHEPEVSLDVRSYADLLNSLRIRSPKDNLNNLCLGHIIGQSANADLFEDLRRGLSRVAFAPETVEPEGAHKKVCHNCGCGC